MMPFRFSARSLARLEGIHPDLVAVMHLAIERTPIDFTVLEGLRTRERQRELVREGKSWTMNSRHLTGHAVDIAPLVNGKIDWADGSNFYCLADVVRAAAAELGVPIEWGGNWKTAKDGPHFQLPWKSYGATDMAPRAKQA